MPGIPGLASKYGQTKEGTRDEREAPPSASPPLPKSPHWVNSAGAGRVYLAAVAAFVGRHGTLCHPCAFLR